MAEGNFRSSDKIRKLPFYLMCDVSYSMKNDNRIGQVNSGIVAIRDQLALQPQISDIAYFGLLKFSDSAEVVVPLGDFSEASFGSNVLSLEGGTSYSSAFALLKTTIEADVQKLKNQNYTVLRPVVFFLSDGGPTDTGWESAFDRLTAYDKETQVGFKYYPVVVPFGIGDADKAVMLKLRHPKAGPKASSVYMTNENANPGEAVEAMIQLVLNSVIESGLSALQGQPQFKKPEQLPPGVDEFAQSEM